MSFVERHISFIAIAMTAVIILRIISVMQFGGADLNFKDGGFLQMKGWHFSSGDTKQSLAAQITATLYKQRFSPSGEEELVTGAIENSSGESAKTPDGNPAAKPNTSGQAGAPPQPPKTGPTQNEEPVSAEKSILEKLGMRRNELEQREQDLANREALLQAAEKRLTDRTQELKVMETELQARLEQANQEKQGLKPVIVMYETMKPKDAARLFEKLDLAVLLPITKAMNPRKLADILATLDPVLAGKVTKSLSATGQGTDAKTRGNSDMVNELPDFSKQGSE